MELELNYTIEDTNDANDFVSMACWNGGNDDNAGPTC